MKKVIHINPNEVEILSQLGTWIVNFCNYDVKLSEGITDTIIPKVNLLINGIDNQIKINYEQTLQINNKGIKNE